MSTSGDRPRRRAAHSLAILLLLALTACTSPDLDLQGVPGTLTVRIRLDPGVAGTVQQLQASFAGTWQNLPAGLSDPSQFNGVTTTSGTLALTQSAQAELNSFPPATNLRIGDWEVAVTVTGDGTPMFSATCTAVPVRNTSDTVLTVTQAGGCTVE